jgi:hypothetical protein
MKKDWNSHVRAKHHLDVTPTEETVSQLAGLREIPALGAYGVKFVIPATFLGRNPASFRHFPGEISVSIHCDTLIHVPVGTL